ncbi:MAG: UbiA family prenyltransferase [Deltaproteobacteria bacterium]|nr:UbiA family prenyltransferase [Deltaproteobacteria bacterium]
MGAALKILADVALYRIRKREMANLAAAATVMVALHLSWDEIAARLGFGILLNLLAYLTNDYCDVDEDLQSPNKDHEKARFLKDHMRAALVLQIVLAAMLAAVGALWSRGLIVALVAGAGICWLYSARLKHVPIADVAAMAVWGAAMPMVAFPLDSLLGWCLVAQLALFSACFETIQVMRDHDEDTATGTRTTAVLLGIERTLVLERLLMVLSAAYAILVVNCWVGLALLVAPLLPFEKGHEDGYWNRVRMVQGLAWLAMVGWIVWSGSTMGLVASVDGSQLVEWLAFIR